MSIARDWLKTINPASYKGVPFWVERDEEAGARRIVIHEFPMRDIPFLEDLGEAKRDFDVVAYVASNQADTEAADVMQICATRGAGILVLPLHGQLTVRCLEFKRDRSKDKHGYVGLSLKFVREGASGALASVASLANLIYIAADVMGAAIADDVAARVMVEHQPDYVANNTTAAIRTGAALLEDIRVSEPVLPAASGTQRTALRSLYSDAPEAAPEVSAVAITEAARALGDSMPAAAAFRAFEGVILALQPQTTRPVVTAGGRQAILNVEAIEQAVRLAALTAYCEAITRAELSDRPAGITLRANVAEYCGAEIDRITPAEMGLYRAMSQLRDSTIEYLSARILDLAPVIKVSANLLMPSLFWAWRLYADPSRSEELVARNRVVHPSFMPLDFEALAE